MIYTYTNDFKNIDFMDIEVLNTFTADYEGYSKAGNVLNLHFSRDLLAGEITTLETIVNSYIKTAEMKIASEKMDSAREFGTRVINDFINESVSLGITQLGLSNHVRKSTKEATDALMKGALYDAIDEIKLIPATDFDLTILTAGRLLYVKNLLEKYLNLPVTASWDA